MKNQTTSEIEIQIALLQARIKQLEDDAKPKHQYPEPDLEMLDYYD